MEILYVVIADAPIFNSPQNRLNLQIPLDELQWVANFNKSSFAYCCSKCVISAFC